MTSRSLGWGTALGVALGVVYAASPLSVWFVIVMTGVFMWAGRGLNDDERRTVWAILGVAVGIRVLALAALFLTTNHYMLSSFFWDGDGVYLKYRALVIRDLWMGEAVPATHRFHAFDPGYGWSTYIYVLAYLQYLVGSAPYGVHLFNVTLYVAAAVVVYRFVRPAFGREPAASGLALMLLLPTLVAWSVSALKESLYIFLCAVGLAAVVVTVRHSRIPARLAASALLAGAIAANGTVRTGSSAIMIAGFGLGLMASLVVRRVSLVLLLLIVLPLGVWGVWESPRAQAAMMEQLKVLAVRHLGNVRTDGNHYQLLDQRIYSDNGVATMRPDEGVRFVVRAAVSFVLVPLPWQVTSRSELVFLAYQIIWYAVVVLACVGFVAGLRRDALVTCLLAGLSVSGAATVALTGGNVGTLIRFRDTIVPFAVWLSALGATATVSRALSGGITMRKQHAVDR